eukprot:240055_1
MASDKLYSWLFNGLSFIVFIITTPFMIYYLYILSKNKTTTSTQSNEDTSILTDQNKSTSRSSICGVTCFMISSISYTIMFIAWFIHFGSTNETHPLYIVIWDAFGLLFYVAGIWIMLFTFLLRIDHAFQKSNNTLLR